MATPDQLRLAEERAHPRVMELWWALRPLASVIRFMQSGAHPDDESTAMLAALGIREGFNLSYTCSTRGEGGQNDIGTEAGADLGALRTREMERACDVLRMRMYWLSESPEDPITDFGFSKSGGETLEKWGRDRTLARFVEVVRTEKPDILCPTFLDVPGQHGHHRAMTESARRVVEAAADPAFLSNLPPWQVKKLYLPAWSGAGQSYDDDEPPPPATLVIDGSDRDPVSGWGWERIGQMSRAYHRTQGMGRWTPPGPARDRPLHLLVTRVPGPDDTLGAGLPGSVADLASIAEIGEAALPLRAAGAAIESCIAAYPDFEAVATHARGAIRQVRKARDACPAALHKDVTHRLDAKEVQLGHVLRLALGAEARAYTADTWLHPGDATVLSVECGTGDADGLGVALDLPARWEATDDALTIGAEAGVTDPYRSFYDPASPPAPAIIMDLEDAEVRLPFDRPPVVLPPHITDASPDAVLVNRLGGMRSVEIALSGLRPAGAEAGLGAPDGWTVERSQRGFRLTLPEDVVESLHVLPITLDGNEAQTVRRISYPHVDPVARARPALVRVRVMDIAVPQGRIGYAGSGNDRVGHWLAAMGADVANLSDDDLASDSALAAFDTIVIGIFAMRFRPGLVDAMPRLHRWVEAGGTLVTLYHRPWDRWDPDTIPPRRLEIGQPSLRWRVTDENADVRHLADHPVLTSPNPIGPADWEGWVKERGLYFAKSWDDAYQPLLEMADPGEEPHRGALLAADIGKGRHVHTSLILHLQMENLVPGAFRLMANLIAPRQ